MSGAIAIFVKTPGYSPVKTRLAAAVGEAVAVEWHRRAAAAVAAVATAAADAAAVRTPTGAPIAPATVYWAVAEADAVRDAAWSGLPVLAQGEGGLGARMGRVHHTLVRRHGAGLLVGADAPQIAAAHLAEALAWCRASELRQVLGVARDGGFWLYGGNRTAPLAAWESVPYGAAETADRFRAAFAPFGAWLESVPLTDVDHVEDLAAMRRELAALASPLPAQRAFAEWLDAIGIAGGRGPAGDCSASAAARERRAGR